MTERIKELEARVKQLEEENYRLRLTASSLPSAREGFSPRSSSSRTRQLSKDEIERYSRQLLLEDGFGIDGQQKLLSSSVLVVGAGGIGSTVLLYLAAAGLGCINIVDFDDVDESNLHRQVIHKTGNTGMNKAMSAAQAIYDLNPNILCLPIAEALTHENVLALIERQDCVIDCSDNPKTRYLLNDACVIAGVPLVSASAIGTEGQVTVFNYKGGPCYRCLYPKPSITTECQACTDLGVLGTVPGLMGILQATEVIKILTGKGESMSCSLLMYHAWKNTFLSLKKPPKRENCPSCGPKRTIRSMEDSRVSLLGTQGPSQSILPPEIDSQLNCTCEEYKKVRESGEPHILLDVRVQSQYDMCRLDGSIHIPLAQLQSNLDRLSKLSEGRKTIYCICRRGLASVEATNLLHAARTTHPKIFAVKNIDGGFNAWREKVDPRFPKY